MSGSEILTPSSASLRAPDWSLWLGSQWLGSQAFSRRGRSPGQAFVLCPARGGGSCAWPGMFKCKTLHTHQCCPRASNPPTGVCCAHVKLAQQKPAWLGVLWQLMEVPPALKAKCVRWEGCLWMGLVWSFPPLSVAGGPLGGPCPVSPAWTASALLSLLPARWRTGGVQGPAGGGPEGPCKGAESPCEGWGL